MSVLCQGEEKCSLLAEACKILLADDAFKIPSPVAEQALWNAKALLEWVDRHQESAIIFEKKVTSSLQGCIDKASSKTGKFHSDRIWTAYHSLRTSDVYVCDWECIMLRLGLVNHRQLVTNILETIIILKT